MADDGYRLAWKPDWHQARRAMADWWDGRGLALWVTAPKDRPWEDIPEPDPNADLATRWLDPAYRVQREAARHSRTFFGGVAFPMYKTNTGPGSLGLFLGAHGELAESTIWYHPCIDDPDTHPPLRFDPANMWWQRHLAIIDAGLREARGRWLVGYPDLIENLDTLAQLRGPQQTLMDLIERPDWVKQKLAEINRAFFEVYDLLWPRLGDPVGGSGFCAFNLWGPGKTAKVQCDFCCMISPEMFREFVLPPLAEQCQWLDFAMFHLDGTQALPQLPNLLSIEGLQAIEWTPQAGIPRGGDPTWYDLYRQIRRAGKGVQAIEVAPHKVLPLIDAVGPEGLFITTEAGTEDEARRLLEQVGWKES